MLSRPEYSASLT